MTEPRTSRPRCREKRLYLTLVDADAAARRINRWNAEADRPERLRPYRCDACGCYHLTSRAGPTPSTADPPRCERRRYAARDDAAQAARDRYDGLPDRARRLFRPPEPVACPRCGDWHLDWDAPS